MQVVVCLTATINDSPRLTGTTIATQATVLFFLTEVRGTMNVTTQISTAFGWIKVPKACVGTMEKTGCILITQR